MQNTAAVFNDFNELKLANIFGSNLATIFITYIIFLQFGVFTRFFYFMHFCKANNVRLLFLQVFLLSFCHFVFFINIYEIRLTSCCFCVMSTSQSNTNRENPFSIFKTTRYPIHFQYVHL